VTEHVQVEMIAAFVIIAGQCIQTWRQVVSERNADVRDKHSTQMKQSQNQAIAEVHEAVNGGWKANQEVIRNLEAEVSKLKAVIAGEPKLPEDRLEEIRGQQ
jgi:hypothetical protein